MSESKSQPNRSVQVLLIVAALLVVLVTQGSPLMADDKGDAVRPFDAQKDHLRIVRSPSSYPDAKARYSADNLLQPEDGVGYFMSRAEPPLPLDFLFGFDSWGRRIINRLHIDAGDLPDVHTAAREVQVWISNRADYLSEDGWQLVAQVRFDENRRFVTKKLPQLDVRFLKLRVLANNGGECISFKRFDVGFKKETGRVVNIDFKRPGMPPGFNVHAPVSEARAAGDPDRGLILTAPTTSDSLLQIFEPSALKVMTRIWGDCEVVIKADGNPRYHLQGYGMVITDGVEREAYFMRIFNKFLKGEHRIALVCVEDEEIVNNLVRPALHETAIGQRRFSSMPAQPGGVIFKLRREGDIFSFSFLDEDGRDWILLDRLELEGFPPLMEIGPCALSQGTAEGVIGRFEYMRVLELED